MELFWNYSLAEIKIVIKARNDLLEDDAENKKAIIYALSSNIAVFVGYVLNGKQLPSYDEVFNTDLEEDPLVTMQRLRAYTELKEDYLNKGKQ